MVISFPYIEQNQVVGFIFTISSHAFLLTLVTPQKQIKAVRGEHCTPEKNTYPQKITKTYQQV